MSWWLFKISLRVCNPPCNFTVAWSLHTEWKMKWMDRCCCCVNVQWLIYYSWQCSQKDNNELCICSFYCYFYINYSCCIRSRILVPGTILLLFLCTFLLNIIDDTSKTNTYRIIFKQLQIMSFILAIKVDACRLVTNHIYNGMSSSLKEILERKAFSCWNIQIIWDKKQLLIEYQNCRIKDCDK